MFVWKIWVVIWLAHKKPITTTPFNFLPPPSLLVHRIISPIWTKISGYTPSLTECTNSSTALNVRIFSVKSTSKPLQTFEAVCRPYRTAYHSKKKLQQCRVILFRPRPTVFYSPAPSKLIKSITHSRIHAVALLFAQSPKYWNAGMMLPSPSLSVCQLNEVVWIATLFWCAKHQHNINSKNKAQSSKVRIWLKPFCKTGTQRYLIMQYPTYLDRY